MNKRPFIDLFIENTITVCFLSAETKGAFSRPEGGGDQGWEVGVISRVFPSSSSSPLLKCKLFSFTIRLLSNTGYKFIPLTHAFV